MHFFAPPRAPPSGGGPRGAQNSALDIPQSNTKSFVQRPILGSKKGSFLGSFLGPFLGPRGPGGRPGGGRKFSPPGGPPGVSGVRPPGPPPGGCPMGVSNGFMEDRLLHAWVGSQAHRSDMTELGLFHETANAQTSTNGEPHEPFV